MLTFGNSILNAGNDPSTLSEHGPQVLGTIQIIRRLFENLSLGVLCSVSEFFRFLNDFGKITVACIRGATAQDIDEGWISEAGDECLQTWVRLADLVQPTDGRGPDPSTGLSPAEIDNLAQYLRSVSFQIVETYVDAKLEQSKQAIIDEEDEDELGDGYKDWVSHAGIDRWCNNSFD